MYNTSVSYKILKFQYTKALSDKVQVVTI